MSARINDREIQKLIAFVRVRLTRGHPGAREEQIDDAIADELERWLLAAPEDVQGDVEKSSKWIFRGARWLLRSGYEHDAKSIPIDPVGDNNGRVLFSPFPEIDTRIELDLFLSQLGRHSFKQLVIVVYHDLYGYSMTVVAGYLGCSVDAAYRLHSRAMKFLAKLAQKYSPE